MDKFLKTGTIILVKGKSERAETIRKFQSKRDKDAGQWNHSGIVMNSNGIYYVVQEAEVEGRKIKAAVVIDTLADVIAHAKEVRYLIPKIDYSEVQMQAILMKYTGVPYNYGNLVLWQLIRTLTGKYFGRKDDKAWKRMTCHEFTMRAWNDLAGLFPAYYRGDIESIFHNKNFRHETQTY